MAKVNMLLCFRKEDIALYNTYFTLRTLIIQASLRSKELCQDYSKAFLHLVICCPFYFYIVSS